MPVNLELKARIASMADARRTAERLQAVPSGLLLQTDTYYRVATGRLKLRVIARGGAELIGYTRAEESSERRSEFLRTPVVDPEGLHRTLERALGILVVVRKKRELYLLKGSRIHLDDVEGLGAFLEFEVPDEGNGTDVVATAMRTLREAFAVTDDAIVRCSYSDLLLQKGNPARGE